MTEKYNHTQIVDYLEEKHRRPNLKTYRYLEECPEFQADVEKVKKEQKRFISPRLSIDLIVVEKKPEPVEVEPSKKSHKERTELYDQYTLFFAVSSKAILEEKNNLEERLLFYQYSLSRITKPKRLLIIVVVPYYVDVPKDALKLCEETGFGLWRVNIEEGQEEVVCPPMSLRTKIMEEFKASVDNPVEVGEAIKKIFTGKKLKDIHTFKEAIKENAENFAIFSDKYIHNAVDAIAGISSDKFGERYIDRRLLNLMFELNNISYRERLQELVNEQLDENLNDYQFVSEVFSILWEENIGVSYSKFLKVFEPALLHVFAEGEEKGERYYRDHYIHQFQVFLLGLCILDKLYGDFKGCNCRNPEISWLIVSSFHDMAYPLQLYDDWSKGFFKKVFNVDVKIADMELKSNFVDQSFLTCMGHLICSLCATHKGQEVTGNWLAEHNELVQFFFREITERKNHCILSSISLLKLIQTFGFDEKKTIEKKVADNKKSFDEILKDVFVPSALAIALHDRAVWQNLRKETEIDHPPKILDSLAFDNCPITFLLILCDNVQEWGRPSKSRVEEETKEMRFYLQNVEYGPTTGFQITIWTPNHLKTEPFFMDKEEELRSIQFFLKYIPDKRFIIRLEDKFHKGEDFVIEGSHSLNQSLSTSVSELQ